MKKKKNSRKNKMLPTRIESLEIAKLDEKILIFIKSLEGDLKMTYSSSTHKGNYRAEYEIQEFLDIICSYVVHYKIPHSINGIEFELIPNAAEQKELKKGVIRFAAASFIDDEEVIGREITFNMMRKIDYYNWYANGGGDLADLTINCQNVVFDFLCDKYGIAC